MKLTIKTFAELQAYARDFADGHFGLLVVVGGAGLSKSTVFRAEGRRVDARYIECGSLSAFGLYKILWESRDKPLILDDIDQIYRDRTGVRLMKSLTQTDKTKTVGWQSAAVGKGDPEDVDYLPREFVTESRLVLILNDWQRADKNVKALEDRGILLVFRPSAEEVYNQAETWFTDTEILEFIKKHLALIKEPSQRHFVVALQLKTAGKDWKKALLETWGINKTLSLVFDLVNDSSFKSEAERVEVFVKETGMSRATYFNLVKKLVEHPNRQKRGRKAKGEPDSQEEGEVAPAE